MWNMSRSWAFGGLNMLHEDHDFSTSAVFLYESRPLNQKSIHLFHEWTRRLKLVLGLAHLKWITSYFPPYIIFSTLLPTRYAPLYPVKTLSHSSPSPHSFSEINNKFVKMTFGPVDQIVANSLSTNHNLPTAKDLFFPHFWVPVVTCPVSLDRAEAQR